MTTRSTRSSARRGDTMELILIFGQKKLPMLVSLDGSDRPGECLTIGHLSDAVFEVSQVEASRQKLIHRGKTLFKNDPHSMQASFQTDLASLGIKNGDRIMLLGRKATEKEDEAAFSNKKSGGNEKSEPLQGKLQQLQSKLDTISERLEAGVISTTSTNSQDLPGLKSKRRLLMELHEESMRLLETVDSITAQEDSGPDFRTQRKALVNALQSKLDLCESHLSDVSSRIQCLEQKDQPEGS
ncbi:Bag family molecular chaperone regulator 1-like [Plakobranchus ocellatus]|uniref:BAG family molecular chaperone regulator 1 n=1 Tax=Plakobranchus ocellatus TaxID=259542 RepID=A0AAV4A9V0_9GAST|nr:Bag family molecular chaperone regulator 1-like [Plakobranchus ocellatus]